MYPPRTVTVTTCVCISFKVSDTWMLHVPHAMYDYMGRVYVLAHLAPSRQKFNPDTYCHLCLDCNQTVITGETSAKAYINEHLESVHEY